MNLSLLEAGLSDQRTVIVHHLLKKNHLVFISIDSTFEDGANLGTK